MSKRPNPLSRLLQQGEQLNFLHNMVVQQGRILSELKKTLPSPLNQHCIHARIDGTRIIVHTDSAVWASQLRFQAPRIIGNFKSRAPGLKKLDIRILPDSVQDA